MKYLECCVFPCSFCRYEDVCDDKKDPEKEDG